MPRRILVADDDTVMLSLYARIFAGTDYSISQAASFAEAAALINSNTYDLLITDLLFPDGVGTELIKLFEEKKTGAKCLLVTGSPAQLDPKLIRYEDQYFEKPFKLEVFMKAVKKALA